MAIPQRLPGVPYALPPAGSGPALVPLPPRVVIIHATDNPTATAAQEASYAHTRPAAGATSAHFYVDGTGALGSVTLDQHAWGALRNGNAISWQVEICGRSGALPAGAVARAATLVCALCDLGGIPLVKLTPAQVAGGARGICGHADITAAYPQDGGTHTDPGWTALNWANFIDQVRNGVSMPTDSQAIQNAYAALLTGGVSMGPPVPAEDRAPADQANGNSVASHQIHAARALARVEAAIAAIPASAGGLSDADRAAIVALTDAVNALNSRLSTP